jgi:hypothetical protein
MSSRDEHALFGAVRETLPTRGYSLAYARDAEGMQQGAAIFGGELMDIRVAGERSQWFVEARITNGDALSQKPLWFDLEAWGVCLEDPILFHHPSPPAPPIEWATQGERSWRLAPQIDYLVDHLAAMEQACSPAQRDGTLACLRDAQDALSAFPSRRARRAAARSGTPSSS